MHSHAGNVAALAPLGRARRARAGWRQTDRTLEVELALRLELARFAHDRECVQTRERVPLCVCACAMGPTRPSAWLSMESNDQAACAWWLCKSILSHEEWVLTRHSTSPELFEQLRMACNAAQCACVHVRFSLLNYDTAQPLLCAAMLCHANACEEGKKHAFVCVSVFGARGCDRVCAVAAALHGLRNRCAIIVTTWDSYELT